MEKVSKKIAAAEVLKLRRSEQTIYMLGIVAVIIIYGLVNIFPAVVPVFVVGAIGLFGWFYMKATQDIERLVKTYGL